MNTIQLSRRRTCMEIVEEVVVEDSWEMLEVNRIMMEIGNGGKRERK